MLIIIQTEFIVACFFFLFVCFFTFNEYFLFTRIPMGMVIPGVGSYTATFK